MSKFEVTIPFKDMAYTATAIADSKSEAIGLVKSQAAQFGFKGQHKKPLVMEVKE